MKMPSLAEMLKAGVHFGHQSSRWHPKMEPYIFGSRNGIHIIDLEKTQVEMENTYAEVKKLVAQGKVILFVGTKRQAREIVKGAAVKCGMPYLTERWIGGLLTNFDECKRRLKKYKSLKEQVASGEVEKYTKKEQSDIKKQIEKMDKYLAGLVSLEKMPDALYVADMRVEKTAITEARKMEVPVIGVCDTNVDPTKATCVIPANDDAVNAIQMIADFIVEAVNEGKKEWEQKRMVPEPFTGCEMNSRRS
jgi:small subunit ribosomal protein S2